jgi:putative hemolysin
VLFVKDVFTQLIEAPGSDGSLSVDVTERLREPFVVPETRSALEILAEMRQRKRGFAVVADEYGGFAGVLTVNDLVSELVGELHDEYDRATRPEIVRIDANRHLVDGSASVDDVRESLNCPIPDGEYVTLAGYLLDAFGHIPVENESIQRDRWTYRVAEMDGRRIAKVVIEGASATI